MLKGSTDDPRASTLKAIADFFNITIDQLLNENLIKESTPETTRLPIHSMNQSKSILAYVKSHQRPDWSSSLAKNIDSYLEVEPSISDKCIVFEVSGDSMWPQFIEGTYIILDTTSIAKHRDFVVYLLGESQQIVLRQYIQEGEDRLLKPLNYGYKPNPIQKNDIFIGIVIQSKSDFRKE